MRISKETKVGVLGAVSITILILGYSYLKGSSIFSKNSTYYAEYKQVSGLGKSDDVVIKGYDVGKVTSMKLVTDTMIKIIVGISIDGELKIPYDSELRIINADLLGEKAVEIVLGKSDSMLEPGGFMKSSIEPSLSESVTVELLPVKNKFEELIKNIDSVIAVIQGTFDNSFQESVDKNLLSIQEALLNFKSITARVDNILESEANNLDAVMVNIRSISKNLSDNEDNINRAFENIASFSDSLAQINFVQTMNEVDASIKSFSEIVAKINSGESSFGALVNDREFYDKLVLATSNLDSLIIDLNRNPRRYIPPLIQLRSRQK